MLIITYLIFMIYYDIRCTCATIWHILQKYIKVKWHYMVIWAEAPSVLQDLNAPEWLSTPYLKNAAFRLLHAGHQRKGLEVSLKFPYCLLAFGPAGTLLHEWLIVVNWYLNHSDKECIVVWENVKVCFVTPTKSSKLFIEYDLANPKVIGIRDILSLCKKQIEGTPSHKLLEGGPQGLHYAQMSELGNIAHRQINRQR